MLLIVAQWGLFVFLDAMVGIIALFLVKHVHGQTLSISDFLMDWVTYYLGILILLLTLFGVLGLLNLSVIMIALLIATILVVWQMDVSKERENFFTAVSKIRRYLRKQQLSHRIWLVGFTLLGLLLALSLAALLEPSTIVDGLTYHLPMPVNWWRSQELTAFYLPFSDYANSYFPGNGQLLYFWTLFTFQDELLVRLLSLVIWLILGLSLYNLFLASLESEKFSFLAVVMFLFTPLVQSQATDLSLDMAFATLFVIALCYFIRFQRDRSLRSLLLFSISSGIFMGIKYSGPAYVFLLFLALIWVLCLQNQSGDAIIPYLGLWISGILVFGGYWYLRNLLTTGNPLFPLRIEFGSINLFSGPYDGAHYRMRTFVNHLGKVSLWNCVRAFVTGYGVAYWLTVIFLLGMLLVGAVRYRQRALSIWRSNKVFLLPIAFIGIGSLMLYLRTPYSVMRFSKDLSPATVGELVAGMRFSLISGVLIMLVVLWGARIIPSFSQTFMLPLTFISVFQGVLAGYDGIRLSFFGSRVFSTLRLLVAFVFSLIVLGIVRYLLNHIPILTQRKCNEHFYHILLLMLLMTWVLPGVGLYVVSQYRDDYQVYIREYGDLAKGWRWVAHNIGDSRIALVGFPTFYPLYGLDWSNEVRYINIVGSIEDRYHDFWRDGGFYRPKGSDYGLWMKNLNQWQAEYIAFSRSPPGSTPEGQWITEHSESFRLLFSNEEFYFFEIR